MIKTISAALLAVSVLAAPALAAAGKNDEVRTTKATPVKDAAVRTFCWVMLRQARGVRMSGRFYVDGGIDLEMVEAGGQLVE